MFKKSKCAFAAKLGVTMLLSMTQISLFPNLVKDAGKTYAEEVLGDNGYTFDGEYIENFLTRSSINGKTEISFCLPRRYNKMTADSLKYLKENNLVQYVTEVELPDVEELPDDIFRGFSNLESVKLSENC